jgi:hypothetical protein
MKNIDRDLYDCLHELDDNIGAREMLSTAGKNIDSNDVESHDELNLPSPPPPPPFP